MRGSQVSTLHDLVIPVKAVSDRPQDGYVVRRIGDRLTQHEFSLVVQQAGPTNLVD